MKFKLQTTDNKTKARAGIITTDHGDIETPVFMPVGTAGSVKGVFHRDLVNEVHAQIILGNTYHLYLRPNTAILEKAGGLHKFISWDKPLLTDSGGFQVFSLAANRKLTELGCEFRSHIDGSKHFFTPESVIDIQRIIGADIIMAFDECPPGTASYDYAEKSLKLTQKWLERCIKQFNDTQPKYDYSQTLFPVVQGCVYKDLRLRAAEHATAQNCEGYAIGGLAVGEPVEQMYEMVDYVADILPCDKPRYLMGVGTPANILENIALGVDMFDCVMPTRNGRNGMLFTDEGIINIKNQKWNDDFSPIDANGFAFVDTAYSKAYLRHLFISGEMLGAQIASMHNIAFYMRLVNEARQHIFAGDFFPWKNMMINKITQRL
ncbi:MAG: tRNA guanosine(34) transglycosylase Tgt [Prevotellaceae bacterium]|jgi:queuine tRNA-ribosyltransferase|nr:tRNA guanosine(34) transglycosylase Tgt [Prevotellaceae bacterium]